MGHCKIIALFLLSCMPLLAEDGVKWGVYFPNNNENFSRAQTPLISWDMDHTLEDRGKNLLTQIKKYGQLIYQELGGLEKIEFAKVVLGILSNKDYRSLGKNHFDDSTTIQILAQRYPILNKKISTGQTFGERFQEINLENVGWDKGMTTVLKELQQGGYLVGIATNQSDKVFNHIAQSPNSPIKDLPFASVFTAQTLEQQGRAQGPVKKPDSRYFQALRAAAQDNIEDLGNPQKERLVIFIDDNLENVKTAQQNGVIAIHHTSAHATPEALRALGLRIDKVPKPVRALPSEELRSISSLSHC